ncbi:hypothetical protein ACWNT8_15470 (plasmid) [Pigmentibacter ruber]
MDKKKYKYLVIVSEDKEFIPQEKDWDKANKFESYVRTNKEAAVRFFKNKELSSKYKNKIFIHIRKFSKIKGFIENKISLKILTPEQELKLKKRREAYSKLSREEKEKLLARNRVNREWLKSGRKPPKWFTLLSELKEGEYLARELAEKIGVSDRNLKITLKKRGIEPIGKKYIDGYYFAYFHSSQFRNIPKKEIEDAKEKLK